MSSSTSSTTSTSPPPTKKHKKNNTDKQNVNNDNNNNNDQTKVNELMKHSSTQRLGPPSLRLPPTPTSSATPFHFVQLADTQFGLAESIVKATLDKKLDTKERTFFLQPKLQTYLTTIQTKQTKEIKESDDAFEFLYQRELDFSERTVNLINNMTPLPKFVVVCGDLGRFYL